jgi:hypothetical protein
MAGVGFETIIPVLERSKRVGVSNHYYSRQISAFRMQFLTFAAEKVSFSQTEMLHKIQGAKVVIVLMAATLCHLRGWIHVIV